MKKFSGQPAVYESLPRKHSLLRNQAWLQQFQDWLRLKKVEHELRNSRRFQSYYERISCPNLAELEKGCQEILVRKIREKKQHGEPLSLPTPRLLNLQIESQE